MSEIFEIKNRQETLEKIGNISYALQIITISRLKILLSQSAKVKNSYQDIKHIIGKLFIQDSFYIQEFKNHTSSNPKNPLLVLFLSNRGFCGSFNQDIIEKAKTYCQENNISYKTSPKLIIGKKAQFIFKNLQPNETIFEPKKDIYNASEIETLFQIIKNYQKKSIDIIFIYNKFKSIVTQELIIEPYYPISEQNITELTTSIKNNNLFFLEPNSKTAFSKLKHYYFYLKFYNVLTNSLCSELGIRFSIMKNSVDSIKDLIEELNLALNKERQNLITQELAGITSTFKAIKRLRS